MSILTRFKDIMASNINVLLDKAEDPEKMIDQYLQNLNKDLGKVKAETASVLAEEQRAKRKLEECQDEMNKMERYAAKAMEAGNEGDARKFLEKKALLTTNLSELQTAYQLSSQNSQQMKQMHHKLMREIEEWKRAR
uniref:PspA/IM30 family protein n=1 Tax=Neobacillus citreus TaxID=2833578 RepID=A0A942T6K2_9BACI